MTHNCNKRLVLLPECPLLGRNEFLFAVHCFGCSPASCGESDSLYSSRELTRPPRSAAQQSGLDPSCFYPNACTQYSTGGVPFAPRVGNCAEFGCSVAGPRRVGPRVNRCDPIKEMAKLSEIGGGYAPLGQSHEGEADAPVDHATHNTILSFGYALARAAHDRRGLSILDWGGGLGHYYVYARALMPTLLDYVVKDLPGLCAAGASLLPEVTFLSEENVALRRSYDFVFASSSLHYARDHYGLTRALVRLRSGLADDHPDPVSSSTPTISSSCSGRTCTAI